MKFTPGLNFLFRQSVISISLTNTVYSKPQGTCIDPRDSIYDFYPIFILSIFLSRESFDRIQGYTRFVIISRRQSKGVETTTPRYERVTRIIPLHSSKKTGTRFFPRLDHICIKHARFLPPAPKPTVDADFITQDRVTGLDRGYLTEICNGISIIQVGR